MPLNPPLSSASVSGSEGLTSPISIEGAGAYSYMNTATATIAATSDIDMQGLPVPRGWRGSIVGEIGDAMELGGGGGGIGALGGGGLGLGLGLIAPVAPRQWRGSIVGEIGEDGVYKDTEGVDGLNRNGEVNGEGHGEVHWTGEGHEDVAWASGGEESWLKMEEGIL